jgi:ribosomal protein L11 methyltransferase
MILPENSEYSSRGKISIYIRSGQAFGNGQHATTEACIHAVENLKLQNHDCVLDIGTGTGILAIVFAKMGVQHITGTELSSDLINEANFNLKLNDVESTMIETDQLKEFDSHTFSVVIANILAPVLLDLMDDMVRVLKPGGTLVLSGFIEKEATLIRKELSDRMLTPKSEYDVRGWKALSFEKG